ncbi:flagellar filament capping protein FliD [Stenotrophomonas nitritireducens]|uniref:flagellar filament capping protein FliD n=1 Tax=Stenotrophomonas nitritireducens TaxID=83617 RepID=UPI003D96F553
MATSSLSVVGSGLDIPTLVKQLVANERKPAADRINTQGSAATAKLSALGSIKSSLGSLQSSLDALVKSASNLAYKATVPDGSGFGATVVTDAATGKTLAAAGTYDVEVLSLAQPQKLTSGAFAADGVVGDGRLTIAWDDQTLNVDISPDSTLADVAAAINKAANGKGVNATVITADDGQHLVLNAVNAGTKGALTISASGGNGGLSALTWDGSAGGLSQTVAASNARVRVDGFERESSSNSISDLIPGITLNLTKAEAGTTKTLTVTQDNAPLKINLQAFVSAYNASVSLLKNSSAYDATNKKASTLTGDSLVRGMQQQMRGQLSANVVDMKALGLAINTDGTLTFNASTFDKTLAENPGAAASLLGKDGKLSTGLSTVLKSNLDSGTGTLTMRTDALNKQIKKLEKDLDALDARMEMVSARYTKQFTSMDALVAQMQGTSNYLAQQLAALQK